MNDEGIGIAGWLLADLTLVLALIFLALVPGRAATEAPPPAEPPVIADIGCRQDGGAAPVVTCEPRVVGERPLRYEWEVERGVAPGGLDAETLTAEFAGAGAIRLVVANEGGKSQPRTYPVLPAPTPAPTPEPTPSELLYRAEFRFDQLVLSGIEGDRVAADDIADARVRERLRKEHEDTRSSEIGEKTPEDGGWSKQKAENLLRQRQDEGYRIALIETFSHSEVTDAHIALSRNVNKAFFAYLQEEREHPPDRCIFLNGPDDVREKWTAAYLDRIALDARSSRINLYFVWAPDAGCEPP